MQTSTIYDCMLLTLPKNHQLNGNLTSITNNEEVPFAVKRIYYLYDVPGGNSRGSHAHKGLYQIMIALSGSFTVTLDDGTLKRSFMLNQPYQGLLIPPGLWRDLDDFSSGSVCMVLASELYEEGDYIREYSDFLNFKHKI